MYMCHIYKCKPFILIKYSQISLYSSLKTRFCKYVYSPGSWSSCIDTCSHKGIEIWYLMKNCQVNNYEIYVLIRFV